MKRRTFIKLARTMPLAAGFLAQQAHSFSLFPQQAKGVSQVASFTTQQQRTVILVELKGGNDGLNTLIPFTDPLYYKLRPSLAIPRKKMLPITASLAMHPAMQPLQKYWQHKDMAWIQGVGYPQSNRSHFRSMDIWDTAANYNQRLDEGWVAHLLGIKHDITGLAINADLGPLAGNKASSLKINTLRNFVHSTQNMNIYSSNTSNNSLSHLLKTERIVAESATRLEQHLRTTHDETKHFPKHTFGRELASIARLINSGINIPSYKISLKGFDTHSMQAPQHQRLLNILSTGLEAFAKNMQHNGHWDNVLLMTYSEFGRQIKENSSKGTDHGNASAHLVMGGKVRGGIYGKNPDLKRLYNNGLRHSIDFRSVYGTIASRWWELSNPWNRPLVPFV